MSGQFTPSTDDHLQLDALKQAMGLAAGKFKDPAKLTQAQVDEALAQLGVKGALTAEGIRRRFDLPWQKLLRVLATHEGDLGRAVGLADRRKHRVPEDEEIAFALQTVAARLGLPTLRPEDYRAERQRLVEADRRAHKHGGDLEQQLPTVEQIETAAKTDSEPGWPRALRIAGLGEREAPGMPACRGSRWRSSSSRTLAVCRGTTTP